MFWWVAAVLAFIIVWLGISIYPNYKVWDLNRRLENFQRNMENYLSDDIYGGKTPQETYEMYVAALKQGDLEKAGKYFYWEREGTQKTKLEEMKSKGELEKYIADLPDWGKMKENSYQSESEKEYVIIENQKASKVKAPDGRGGYVEIDAPAGDYVIFSVSFQLNKQANIWKLFNL